MTWSGHASCQHPEAAAVAQIAAVSGQQTRVAVEVATTLRRGGRGGRGRAHRGAGLFFDDGDHDGLAIHVE